MDNIAYENTEGQPKEEKYEFRNDLQKKCSSSTDKKEEHTLQRTIGFFSCVGLVVGMMIGSGIFITPTRVLAGSGSIGMALIIWAICGMTSIICSLAFIELGSYLPVTGGQYMYLLEAFAPDRHEKRSAWRPLFGFIFVFMNTCITRPASFVIQGLAIAEYLSQLSPLVCDKNFEMKILASCILLLVTFINCLSNKVATRVVNIFTCLKVSALIFVMISGFTKLAQGTNEALKTGMEGTNLSPDSISAAFYSGFWAYAGWDGLTMVSREIKNPQKNIMRALVVGISAVTVIYMMVNVSYFIVLTKEEFQSSGAVAVDFSNKILGKTGIYFMIISVALSIFGSTVGGSFSSVRSSYAAAREHHLLDIISYLNIRSKTPIVAIIFNILIALMMLPYSNIVGLISFLGFVEWIFMIQTMIALIILRKTHRARPDVIKMPLFVPYLTIVVSLFLLVMPFVQNPRSEYLFAIAIFIGAIITYVVFVYYKNVIPFLRPVCHLVQKIFLVAPPNDKEF